MIDKNWLTVADAAELVGCSPQRIRFLALNKQIKAELLTGKCWMIERKAIEDMAKNPPKVGRPRKVKKTL